jgi:hypothetical protein
MVRLRMGFKFQAQSEKLKAPKPNGLSTSSSGLAECNEAYPEKDPQQPSNRNAVPPRSALSH